MRNYENEYGDTVYKNQLNVSVAPAAALEFQHFKDRIIENINSYFGYKAIFDLRIQQNYIISDNMETKTQKKLTNDENDTIHSNVDKTVNQDLKNSLINLGKNIITEK